MAVGASKPTVLADKDGFFSVKNKMLVSYTIISGNLIQVLVLLKLFTYARVNRHLFY